MKVLPTVQGIWEEDACGGIHKHKPQERSIGDRVGQSHVMLALRPRKRGCKNRGRRARLMKFWLFLFYGYGIHMAGRHNVQLVFQGGGAKLVALIGAAQAAYEAQENGDISITRISGTSAGAIAGCILATGKSPELFRRALIGTAKEALGKIIKPIGTFKSKIDVVFGQPLYGKDEYRRFLRALFYEVAEMQHMQELQISCLFHATDARNGKPKTFDGSQNDHTIEEALFCSSALPFIFETYNGSAYVDGGLINNFPSDSLLGSEEQGDVLGFGFKKTGVYDYDKSIKEYAKALIFTAMDVSIARSLEKLPKENVKYINTVIDTLDFEKAVAHLSSNTDYGYYVDQAKQFFMDYAQRKKAEEDRARTQWDTEAKRIKELEDQQRDREKALDLFLSEVKRHHNHLIRESKFHLLSKTVIATCNGLLQGDPSIKDDVIIKDIIAPLTNPVSAYGATIGKGNKVVDVGNLRPRIVKLVNGVPSASQGYEVLSVRFPLNGEGASLSGINEDDKTPNHNLMFFFHPALSQEEGVSYEISFAFKGYAILTDVLDKHKNEDAFVFFCETCDTDLFQLVLRVPHRLRLSFDSLPRRLRDVYEALRAERFAGQPHTPVSWIDSQEMAEEELTRFDASADFVCRGWRASTLHVGHATGILAHI